MGSASGGNWTPYAKHQRARAMYWRGKNFLLASALLEKRGGDGFAVLYLLCQSVEVVLKALLVMRDYERYKPRLKGFGHDIAKLAEATRLEFKLGAPGQPLRKELGDLSRLYHNSINPLRYASFLDLMVDPSTIPRALVVRRLMAVLRLTERELARADASSATGG